MSYDPDERPSRAELAAEAAAEDVPERDEENACPECPEGVVVDAGPMERETGHVPYACSARCGYRG